MYVEGHPRLGPILYARSISLLFTGPADLLEDMIRSLVIHGHVRPDSEHWFTSTLVQGAIVSRSIEERSVHAVRCEQ